MPKPKAKESQNDFLKRCIPQVIKEGKRGKQAIAICASLWTQGKKK